MSWKTISTPARFISADTRAQISKLVDLDNFASNVHSRLLALGENELAQRFIDEIEASSESACAL